MKKILVLNGSGRKNGYTSALVKAFIEGALESGNEVKEHFIHDERINACLGCDSCMRIHQCVQKDEDMLKIYDDLSWCDVVVFASPEYWGTWTAELKNVLDRMFGWFNKVGYDAKRESVLLMTARGDDYSMALEQYHIFHKYLGWKDLGMVLGREKEADAKALGKLVK